MANDFRAFVVHEIAAPTSHDVTRDIEIDSGAALPICTPVAGRIRRADGQFVGSSARGWPCAPEFEPISVQISTMGRH